MKSFGEALQDKRLKDSTFRLYCCIWKNVEVNNKPFIKTNEEITNYTGMSKSTIHRGINQLIDLGYITVSKGQKVSVEGQIRILNDEAYRTINVTDSIEAKPKKKSEKNIKDEQSFELFWKDKVKNKKGKESALKAWKKLSIEEQRLAYKMLGYYYSSVSDSRYYAHISTWLNGKRFNDEDIVPSHEKPSGSRYTEYVEDTKEDKLKRLADQLKKFNNN